MINLISLNEKISDYFFPDNKNIGFKIFFTIIILGIFFRLFFFIPFDYGKEIHEGDSSYYYNAAINFIETGIISNDSMKSIPTFYRPPLYIIFLASCLYISNYSIFFVQIIQILMSIATCLLATRISAKLNLKCSHIVFILTIFSPFDAMYANKLLSENLTIFLLMLSFFFLTFSKANRGLFFSGIAIGLCCLTRDSFLLLSPFMCIIIFFFYKNTLTQKIIKSLIILITTIIVIAPWSYRNYLISDDFVPITKGRLGLGIFLGTWAIDGEWSKIHIGLNEIKFPEEAYWNPNEKKLIESEMQKGKNFVQMENIYFDIAIKRILNEPARVLKNYLLRSPKFFIGTRTDLFDHNKNYFQRYSLNWYLIKSFFWGINFIILIFGLIGILLSLKNKNKVLILSIPLIYSFAVHIPLNSYEIRYSQPTLNFLIIFGSIYLKLLIDYYKKIKTKNRYY